MDVLKKAINNLCLDYQDYKVKVYYYIYVNRIGNFVEIDNEVMKKLECGFNMTLCRDIAKDVINDVFKKIDYNEKVKKAKTEENKKIENSEEIPFDWTAFKKRVEAYNAAKSKNNP